MYIYIYMYIHKHIYTHAPKHSSPLQRAQMGRTQRKLSKAPTHCNTLNSLQHTQTGRMRRKPSRAPINPFWRWGTKTGLLAFGASRSRHLMRLIRCKTRNISKEPCNMLEWPCIMPKEPCIRPKEPCNMSKEPCNPVTRSRRRMLLIM